MIIFLNYSAISLKKSENIVKVHFFLLIVDGSESCSTKNLLYFCGGKA